MATQHARMKILSIFGTRPEAIKMAPLVKALAAEPGIDSRICITGQHQSMLQQVLDMFELKADYSLDVMRPHQPLNSLTAALYAAIDPILEEMKPDKVLVTVTPRQRWLRPCRRFIGRSRSVTSKRACAPEISVSHGRKR